MNRLCILLVCFVTQIIAVPFGNLYFGGQMTSPVWEAKSQFYWPDPLRIFQTHHDNLMRLLGWKSQQFPIQQRFANPPFGPFQQSFEPTTFRPPPNFVLPPVNPEENEIYRAPNPFYQNPALPPPPLNYLPSSPYPAAPYPPAGVPWAMGPLPVAPLPTSSFNPGPAFNYASTSPSNSLISETTTTSNPTPSVNAVANQPSMPSLGEPAAQQNSLPSSTESVQLASSTASSLSVQPVAVPNRISGEKQPLSPESATQAAPTAAVAAPAVAAPAEKVPEPPAGGAVAKPEIPVAEEPANSAAAAPENPLSGAPVNSAIAKPEVPVAEAPAAEVVAAPETPLAQASNKVSSPLPSAESSSPSILNNPVELESTTLTDTTTMILAP